jgi:effector-binding domain-containing protein
MEIKNIEKQKVYCKEFKTTLKEIQKFVAQVPAELAAEIQNQGMEIIGNQIWRYLGGDGNPETEFTLQIAFPIKENGETYEQIREYNDFKCFTGMHYGAWSNFGKSYEKIMGELMVAGHKMTGEIREIYHVVDFEDQEKNITEIQVGIQ